MILRRDLLKALVATSLSPTALNTPSLHAAPEQSSGPQPAWKNWSGNLSASPKQRLAPASREALQEFLASSRGKIRTVGSGHSFSPLVPTDETMLSVVRLQGLLDANASTQQATLAGGTSLKAIGPLLDAQQQALINMPDIDQQSIAGAISTATHGTGRELKCLSAYVTELGLVDARGDFHLCNAEQNRELFHAARAGLGALGVITQVTMQNRSPFNLKREARWWNFEDAIDQADSLSRQHRNFEFYTIPFTQMALSDSLDITEASPQTHSELDGNDGLMDLKLARDYLGWSKRLRELVLSSYMRTLPPESSIDKSYDIYASERNVRFNEMEYHLPRENGLRALREVKQLIERQFPEVFFPIECRFVAADDVWLSPFYQRDTISIAVHRYFEEDYKPLYRAIEPIFQSYGGRPHWGKINTFSSQQFSDNYEKWKSFKAVRKAYDPEGRFLNPYLTSLFAS